MSKFIPLSVPNIKGNEKKYVIEALDDEWVSSAGPHITKFEEVFKDYTGSKASCACQSGSAGLHLCLINSGIVQNDIVLVPTLTFIATINVIMYQKSIPVFFDCDDSLGMNVKYMKEYLEQFCYMENGCTFEKETNNQVKAIIPVHVFGNPCDMYGIMELAKKYNLVVIEDATEALGTKYTKGSFEGEKMGTVGDYGVFSFNGNKIITTGGGGMVVSNDSKTIDKIRYYSTQAKDDLVYFVHNHVGYNYRMTNLQAALGLGQMEQIEKFIKTKRDNYLLYKELLSDSKLGYILDFDNEAEPNYWFYSFMLNEPNAKVRDRLMEFMLQNQVQTRPIWKLNHTQIPFQKFRMVGGENAQRYYDSIINIPCSSNLQKADVEMVCKLIKMFEEVYEK